MSSSEFNEHFRFGSAGWADSWELRRAGLFQPKGPQIGFFGKHPLFLDSDAPMLTIGGAGSGKLRDLLGYVVCNTPGQRMIVLDPRGELSAISWHVHAAHGEFAWYWNPFGLHGLPQHSCNPLDLLDASQPTFHADCKFLARALIPVTGSAESKYFEQRAASWVEAFLKFDVELQGATSLPRLSSIVNMIETGDPLWPDYLEAMLASSFEDVRRTAGEIATKQQDSPREFGSVMGEVYAHLGFLDDPVLLDHLGSSDFSLEYLCSPVQALKMFLIVPAEYLAQLGPVLRLLFTGTVLWKSRKPAAPRVMMLVDEAGQLGAFDSLLQAFTYGRGAGIRPWALFQDVGQIIRNYGPPGLQGFLGSAQMRQFVGIRDYETAQTVSGMLGTETLEYTDPRFEEASRHQKMQALQRAFGGDDPFSAVLDLAHHSRNAALRSKHGRKLMTEDEILAMPNDKQILFISGKDLPPIYADKRPYFQCREMAGRYLPNPYHPPADRVQLAGWFGTKWAQVIREDVPANFIEYPQYAGGSWAYVNGYRPS